MSTLVEWWQLMAPPTLALVALVLLSRVAVTPGSRKAFLIDVGSIWVGFTVVVLTARVLGVWSS